MKYLIRIDGNSILSYHSGDVDELPLDVIEVTKEVWQSGIDNKFNTIINGVLSRRVIPASPKELRREFITNREVALKNLTVTVDSMVFDADELSRSRMSDSIVALNQNEKKVWVLANNSVVDLTREKLIEVLRAIATAQNALWVQNT